MSIGRVQESIIGTMRGPSETGSRSENVSFGRRLSAKSWTMLLVKVNLPSKPCTAPLRPWQMGLRACSMHPKNTLLSHMASWKLAAALFNKHVKSGMPMLIEHVKRLQNRSFSYPWTSWWIFALPQDRMRSGTFCNVHPKLMIDN